MKIIHITDTHLRPPGERIYGLDPTARLAAVIADVDRRHRDADLLVITGDLADSGQRESYETLRDLLAPLRMPRRLLLGNHDRREAFRAVFPEMPTDENGFIQSIVEAPRGIGRFIFLDSLDEEAVGGVLCDRRLDWLASRLAESPDEPVTLFLHHPPVSIGVPHFEPICMADPGPFLDLVAAHPGGVRHIFVGHLHLPFSGSIWNGIAMTAARSTNHHMAVDFSDAGARWIAGSAAYNVILMESDSLFVHPIDRLDDLQIGYGQACVGP